MDSVQKHLYRHMAFRSISNNFITYIILIEIIYPFLFKRIMIFNTENMHFFQPSLLNETHKKDFMNANKPFLPAWKDLINDFVEGATNKQKPSVRMNMWREDDIFKEHSSSTKSKIGLFEKLYNPDIYRKNYNYGKLKKTKAKNDADNDFLIDESYLNELQVLNASIDPLFCLNLAKIKSLPS